MKKRLSKKILFAYTVVTVTFVALFIVPTAAMAQQGSIVITNGRAVGKNIILNIEAEGTVNISGATGTFVNGQDVTYKIENQTVTIEGDIRKFSCGKNFLNAIEIKNCDNLKILSCYTNNLERLDLSGCPNLDSLFCYENKLTVLDPSPCKNLVMFNCSFNQLTELDVTQNTKLEKLYFYKNNIETFKLGEAPKLEIVSCFGNKLTSLDLSNRTSIRLLVCNTNKLTSLKLDGCSALKTLQCYTNKLTELSLKGNTSLETLHCYSNELTSIDLSDLSVIKQLYCYQNKLTAIDLSKNPLLEKLSCFGNNLSAIDLSYTPNINELWCHQNQLSQIDVSVCPKLYTLSCMENKLTSLDVSKNIELESVFCSSNELTSLDFTNNPKLVDLECEGNKIKGASMTRLMLSLPVLPNKSKLIIFRDSEEQNVCNVNQVTIAKEKKWDVRYMSGGLPKPYKGSDVAANTFWVKLKGDENGTIDITDKNIDLTEVLLDTELVIEAKPKEGYHLTSLKANEVDILADRKFKVQEATTVVAEFAMGTSLDNIVEEVVSVYPTVATNFVTVEGVAPHTPIKLFSVNGQCLSATQTDYKGVAVLNVEYLLRGTYIVYIADKAYKIVKK